MTENRLKRWEKDQVFDVLNSLMSLKESPRDLAHRYGRTIMGIKAVLNGYRVFKMHPDSRFLSKSMKEIYAVYTPLNGKSVLSSSPVSVMVDAPVTIEQVTQELDDVFEKMKSVMAKAIEVGVDMTCKQKNKRILELEAEVRQLREFKEEAKKSSIWAQLTQKLNNMS